MIKHIVSEYLKLSDLDQLKVLNILKNLEPISVQNIKISTNVLNDNKLFIKDKDRKQLTCTYTTSFESLSK